MPSLKPLILSLITVLILLSTAHAEPPKAVLAKLLDDVQRTGNQEAIVDYVDWETAFALTSQTVRESTHSHSPLALRDYHRKLYTNPQQVGEERVNFQLKALPEEGRAQLETLRPGIVMGMVNEVKEENSRILRAKFTIGEEQVSGEKGTVELLTAIDGENVTQQIQFVQKNGNWLWPYVQPLGRGATVDLRGGIASSQKQ